MNFKHILYALLVAMIPFMYSALTGKFPTFPLSAEQFGAVVLWLIGLLVGGWQTAKYFYLSQGRLKLIIKGMVVSAEAIAKNEKFKSILYAIVSVIAPILYQMLIGWKASFPLPQADFVAVILWIVGLMVGGWQVAKAVYKGQARLS